MSIFAETVSCIRDELLEMYPEMRITDWTTRINSVSFVAYPKEDRGVRFGYDYGMMRWYVMYPGDVCLFTESKSAETRFYEIVKLELSN